LDEVQASDLLPDHGKPVIAVLGKQQQFESHSVSYLYLIFFIKQCLPFIWFSGTNVQLNPKAYVVVENTEKRLVAETANMCLLQQISLKQRNQFAVSANQFYDFAKKCLLSE